MHDAIKGAKGSISQSFLTEFADASKQVILFPSNSEHRDKLDKLSQASFLQTLPKGRKLSIVGSVLVTATILTLTLMALPTLTILWTTTLLSMGTLIASIIVIALCYQPQQKRKNLFNKGSLLFSTTKGIESPSEGSTDEGSGPTTEDSSSDGSGPASDEAAPEETISPVPPPGHA